jgi:hypothetical protein
MATDKEHRTGFRIKPTGWTHLGAPMLRVFVDDACVAVLKDKNVNTIPIPAGRHRVQARRDFVRSQPLEIDLPAGQLVDLGYGYDYSVQNSGFRRLKYLALLGVAPAAILLTAIGVPSAWGFGMVIGVFSILAGRLFWQCYGRPGSILFLERVTEEQGRRAGTANERTAW